MKTKIFSYILLVLFQISVVHVKSQEFDCEGAKQWCTKELNNAYDLQKSIYDNCKTECAWIQNMINDFSNLIKSIDCSCENCDYSSASQSIINKYEGNFPKCTDCLNGENDQKEIKSGSDNTLKSPKSLQPTAVYKPREMDPAEKAAKLSNALANINGRIESTNQDRQNKLNEISQRDLSNKIELQPKIPEQYYADDKKNIASDLYGETNTGKFKSSFGDDNSGSLDDILGESTNNEKKVDQSGLSPGKNAQHSYMEGLPGFSKGPIVQIDKYSNQDNLLDYYTRNVNDNTKGSEPINIKEKSNSFCETIGFSPETCNDVSEFGKDLGGTIKKAGDEAIELFPQALEVKELGDNINRIIDPDIVGEAKSLAKKAVSKVTSIPTNTLNLMENTKKAIKNAFNNSWDDGIFATVEDADKSQDEINSNHNERLNKVQKNFYKDILGY